MRTHLSLALVAAVATLSLPVQPAHAQVANRAVADVPFDFAVADENLPAGRYVVEIDGINRAVVLRHAETNHGVFVISAPASNGHAPAPRSVLRFVRQGGQVHLSQVWRAGETIGNEFRVPRAVEEVRRRGDTVEVALLRLGR